MSIGPASLLIGSVLVGGSAGGEEAVAPPSPPLITEMPVVYRVPGMDEVQVRRNVVYRTAGETRLELDVYSPSAAPSAARRPAVVLIHGGPVPEGARPKDWGVFVSYGRMLAASGFTAVTFNHRFYGAPGGELSEAAADVATAVAHLRQRAGELGVDPARMALWAFSGGGPLLSAPLRERWPFVRAILNDDDRSREIIARTLDFLKHHLAGGERR